MPYLRQTSFLGGELAPQMWGRTDLSQHAKGLRAARNFFVSKQGALVSRPGTTLVAAAGNANVRLVPFVYSDTQSYVVEFSDSVVRFYYRGGVLESSPGVAVTVASPFLAVHLERLQWAQVGDVLVVTASAGDGYAACGPYELRRTSHTSWSMVATSFSPPAAVFADAEGVPTVTAEPMIVGRLVFTDPTTGAPAPGGLIIGPNDEDATHPAREWRYKSTLTVQDPTSGAVYETLPADVGYIYDGTNWARRTALTSFNLVVYPDKKVTLRRAVDPSAIGGAPYKVLAINYYRGRGDLFGFIGQTKTRDFVDVGAEPDYSLQPPRGTNPFSITNASGVVTSIEKPNAVAFFQGRLTFGGMGTRPGTLLFSATNNYANFDPHKVDVAGEALVFELASRRREIIRSLVGLDRLMVLTNSSAWSIGGQVGAPLDFDSVDARCHVEVGANHMPPIAHGNLVLYARARGVGVYALEYSSERNGFSGIDVSLASSHLFTGKGDLTRSFYGSPAAFSPFNTATTTKNLWDWAFAQEPWGVVWAVRDDGVLLSATAAGEDVAWTRHDTYGWFRQVCVIPEDGEDAVYLAVARPLLGSGAFLGTTVCIERMTSRVKKGTADDIASVDCALRYEGAPTNNISGLGHLEGQQVYAVGGSLPVYGPFTVSGGAITLPVVPPANSGSNLVLYIGLRFQPQAETLDIATTDARMRQKTVSQVGIEVDESRGLEFAETLTAPEAQWAPWRQRDVSDSYGAVGLSTEVLVSPILSGWNIGGRVALRQSEPLPVTLVGLTREVAIGGD